MLDAACKERTVALTILGAHHLNGSLTPDLFNCTVQGALRDVLYHPNRFDRGEALMESYFVYGNDLTYDLKHNATPLLPWDGTVLCHSGNALVMYAVARWLKSLDKEKIPPVLINLQNHISEDEVDETIYCASLKLLDEFPTVRIFGSNVNICRLLKKYAGRDIPMLPLPFEYPAFSGNSETKEGPVFGFAGEARPEKNLWVFAPAMKLYLEQGGKGRFNIQAHFFLNDYPDTRKAHEQLIALGEQYPDRVLLRFAPLYGIDYYRHIAACDAIVLPYPPELYKGRISQVAMDAVAMGTSTVVPKNSSLEDDVRRLNNGSAYIEEISPSSLAETFFAFENGWRERKQLAASASRAFREFNNKEVYLNIVLDREGSYALPALAWPDATPPTH